MKTIKQFSESKATEKGERDVGSKAYTDYVTDLTPGAVTNKDAKKSDRETKKTNALKIHRATRLDDAIDPEIEQLRTQYEREKKELRQQHIRDVANVRANKIGENLVPDPVPADVYNYTAKKGAIAAPGSGSIAKARKAKSSDLNKSIEQQMVDARKEGWEELDPNDVLIEYDQDEVEITEMTPKERRAQELRIAAHGPSAWEKSQQPGEAAKRAKIAARYPGGGNSQKKQRPQRAGPGMVGVRDEEVEEEATYSERISEPVPAGNASKARGTSKVRKYRQITPGQVRDYEKLTATRMFQAYEDAPANATGPAIANWDPLLGGENSPRVYVRKRRKIDARSKDYREAIKRTQARRDAVATREAEHKLNMFGVQSNPFKEETEMNNKKYLTTKEGSIESAVVKSVGTETFVNPNDARPILHLPNKYLASKADSLESVVTEVVTEKDVSGQMRFDIKRLTGPEFRNKYRMTKQAAMTPGGGITHKKGRAVLHHEYEPQGTEVDETHAPGHGQKSSIGTPLKQKRSWNPATHKLVTLPSGQSKVVKKDDPKHSRSPESESVEMEAKEGKPHFMSPSLPSPDQQITDPKQLAALAALKRKVLGKKNNKKIDEKDSRRTDDAIDAYDKSKDASRDADWDTEHGKKGKGDKEKKYAKKERGEIDKDDPKWKHKKGHTGMHGEEVEIDELTGASKENLKKKYLKISKDAAGGSGAIADTGVLRQRIADAKPGSKKVIGKSHVDSGKDTQSPEHMAMLKRKLKNRQKGIKTAAKRIYAKPETAEYVPQGTEIDEAEKLSAVDQATMATARGNPEKADAILKARRKAAQDKRERATLDLPAPKSEETDPSDLIAATVNELDKKTLGRYAMANVSSTADAAMALQRSTDRPGGQTRDDVNKHVRTLQKRREGMKKVVQKLSKDEYEPQGTAIDEDKLSYKERQNLPKGAFALPGKGSGPEGKQGGSYPIPDESHARNALARVSQHGSEAEKATVRRAVHKKFPEIKVSESVMRDLLTLELDETHSPKDRTALDKAIKAYQDKGGKTTVLKPGTRLKGMDPSRKAVIKARKEEVEIDEARSVDSAMSIISSIVKNKQAGEIIHGDRKKSKVDLYSASAIQQVYNALNRKNQEKMEKVMSKNRQGLAKMADFSMSMMK